MSLSGSLDAMSDQRYIGSKESYIHDFSSVQPDACTRNNEVDQGEDCTSLANPSVRIRRCPDSSAQCFPLHNWCAGGSTPI